MKNKSLILLLLTAVSFALFGCGAKTEPIEAEKPVEIVEEQTDDTTVDEATTEAAAAKKAEGDALRAQVESLLTEDLGVLYGEDDCKCGKCGKASA